MGNLLPLIVGIFIIKQVFFSDPSTPKLDYTVKIGTRLVKVEHCVQKDGIIVYKKEGKRKQMIASRSVKCIKTER